VRLSGLLVLLTSRERGSDEEEGVVQMSQGVYKIISARPGRSYNGKHGELVVWLVKLENANPETPGGEFELHKKPGNTPNPGDSIEVDRFAPGNSPDGTPFVRIFAASQQGATSSTGGSGYQKSPDQQRSIVRQHSQEMALRLIAATGDASDMDLSDPGVAGTYLNGVVRRLTDWFAADAMGASSPKLNGAAQEVPADTEGLVAAAPARPADDSLPF
jgi:hypothetical protein